MMLLPIEEVKNRLNQSEIELIGEYITAKTSTKLKCKCGKEFVGKPSDVFRKHLKSCGCYQKSKPSHYQGTKNVGLDYFVSITRGLIRKRKTLEFDITIEYLQELLEKQNFKCALSGLDISDKPIGSRNRKLRTFSLDRIDSSKGYVVGNVQWVHKTIQKMKMDLQQEEFIYFCQQVSRNQEILQKVQV